MSPFRLISNTRRRRGLAAVLGGAALLGAVPAAASADDSIRLRFQKECLGTTCTGTLITASGQPVPGTSVSASLSPLWFESGVIGFSATETISSSRGSFTMNHLGVNDVKADPDAIHVLGAVVSGSWDRVPLAGGLVRIQAFGVPPSSVRGTILIDAPADAD
jgi:hypothetical protein